MAPKDPIEALLHDTFSELRLRERAVLETSALPEPDRLFHPSCAGQYHKMGKTRGKELIRTRSAAMVAAAFLMVLLTGFHPQVQALRSQWVHTLYEAIGDMTVIRQSTQSSSDLWGETPPALPRGSRAGALPPALEADEAREAYGARDAGEARDAKSIQSLQPEKTSFDTLAQARAAADIPLMTPVYLPEGFALSVIEITAYGSDFIVIEQIYDGPEDRMLHMTQEHGIQQFASTTGTTLEVLEIRVWGQTAVMITNHSDFSSVSWYKENARYTLSGRISSEETARILEGLHLQ